MKETILDYIRLTRPGNLVFVVVLLWVMEKWVATPILRYAHMPEQLPWWLLLLIILGTVFIAAGGYVINAYFDVKIDRINHPDSLIVTRTVDKPSAMLFFQILTGLGLACGMGASWACHSTSMAMVYVMVPGLMWFYSASYKRQFLLGNLIIAFSSALTPMLIGLANDGWMQHQYGDLVLSVGVIQSIYVWTAGFALFAFLMTWMREIVKDLEDQMGDRELECHTVPIVLGDMWAKVLVTVLVVVVMAMTAWLVLGPIPFSHEWHSLSVRFMVFAIEIPLVCELCLLWSAKIPSDYRSAQQLLKFIMALGTMYGFVIERSLQ